MTFVEKFARYCETVVFNYTYEMSKDKRTYLVNKDISYICCLPDFVEILKILIGQSRTSLKLFVLINEKILANVADKTVFESIKDVFIDHICKSKVTDSFINIITTKILLKRNSDIGNKDSFYMHAPCGLAKCLALFIYDLALQIKDFKVKEIIILNLMQTIKVYISSFNRHEIYFNDLDELMQLINLLEMLEFERKSPENEKNLIEIETIRFTKIFYYVQCKDKNRQLSSVYHLNQYNFKNNNISAQAILNVIEKKPVFQALFIKYPHENFLSRLTPFFVFISPAINFTVLSQLLRIKKTAPMGVAYCIKNCLNIFMQKIDSHVNLLAY